MAVADKWYVKAEDGSEYGPVALDVLVRWAREGRIEPSGSVSTDRKDWKPASRVPELGMRCVLEAEPGQYYGPVHPDVVKELVATKQLSASVRTYRLDDGKERAAELDGIRKKLSESEAKAAALQNRLDESEALLRQLSEKLSLAQAIGKSQADGLTAELQKVGQELASVKSREAVLLEERASAQRREEALKKTRMTLAGEHDKLVSEHDKLISERDSLVSERDGLVAERDRLVSKCDKLVSERNALISEREGLVAEKASAESRIAALTEDVRKAKEEAERRRTAGESERSELVKKLVEGEKRAATLKGKLDVADGQLSATVEQNKGLAAELAAAREKLGQALAANEEFDATCAKTRKQLETLKDELALSKKRADELQAKLKKAEKEKEQKKSGGLFKGLFGDKSADQLAFLERIAQQEMAAARNRRRGGGGVPPPRSPAGGDVIDIG